ncbi:hypothetical protein LCGC14_2896890, partial [marine sediment metagenome]
MTTEEKTKQCKDIINAISKYAYCMSSLVDHKCDKCIIRVECFKWDKDSCIGFEERQLLKQGLAKEKLAGTLGKAKIYLGGTGEDKKFGTVDKKELTEGTMNISERIGLIETDIMGARNLLDAMQKDIDELKESPEPKEVEFKVGGIYYTDKFQPNTMVLYSLPPKIIKDEKKYILLNLNGSSNWGHYKTKEEMIAYINNPAEEITYTGKTLQDRLG